MQRTWIRSLLLILAALLALSGCASNNATGKTSDDRHDSIPYTNLNSEEHIAELDTILNGAGVTEDRRSAFFHEVAEFNASVPADALTTDWETDHLLGEKYDPYKLQDAYTAKNPDFTGYNCRITAFQLMSDFITTGSPAQLNTDNLFMDLTALGERSAAAPTEEEMQKFKTIFAQVPAAQSNKVEDQLQAMTQEWEKRGVSFHDNEGIHLISVVFHDQPSEEENVLFIGHVGVLLEDRDKLYFVEKVAFQEPYRVLMFKDRSELNDYLMGKYDVSWGQETAPPFLMEDDHLMDGYRENPLKTQ